MNSDDEYGNNKNNKDNLCYGIYLQKPYFHLHFVWNPRVLCITIWERVLDTLDVTNAASWRMEFLLTTSHISAHIMILALSF
jgi:hypothetical protein